jgi:DNA-binding transcriptional ArsR family regulator
MEELYTTHQLAEAFGLTPQVVTNRLLEAKVKPAQKDGRKNLYRLADIGDALGGGSMDEAKLAKLQAEAALKEFELAVKRKEYASVAEFSATVSAIFSRLYKRLAVQMPERMSKKLAKKDSAEISKALKDEITREFENLRADFTEYL